MKPIYHVYEDEAEFADAARTLHDALWDSFLPQGSTTEWHTDKMSQLDGIDRTITLPDGRTMTADDKVRKKTWRDVLLETQTNGVRGRSGWLWTSRAGLVCYAWLPTRSAVIFPLRAVRRAAMEDVENWQLQHGIAPAYNVRSYVTLNIPMPTNQLVEIVDKFHPHRPCWTCSRERRWSEIRAASGIFGCADCNTVGQSPWGLKLEEK